MYKDKRYRVRPLEEIFEDIALAKTAYGDVKRVFLCDGDAVAMDTEALLAILARLLRRMDHALGWAVFSGLYGLCFGGLCAAVYLVAKTPAFALSWWLSGLSYDAMHGVGNFALMLLLYRPLRTALRTAKKQIHG